MSPRSTDADVDISIHSRIGRGKLNLTRTERAPAEPDLPALRTAPLVRHKESNKKAEGIRECITHGGSKRGAGSFASKVHGALCMTGFLLVMPSGVLVVQYAKITGSSWALRIHRLLQFGFGS